MMERDRNGADALAPWACIALMGGLLLGASLMANASGANGAIFALPGDRSDWIAFWGSLIGAAATIAAGVLAWIAAQKQIHHKENSAQAVVDAKLIEYLGIADIAWRAIDKAIERDRDEFTAVADIFCKHLDDNRAQKLISEIDAISKELSAPSRDKISTIIEIANRLRSEASNQGRINDESQPSRLTSIYRTRNILSWLNFAVNEYSTALGIIFEGRTKPILYDGSTHQQGLGSLEAVWAGIEDQICGHSATSYPNADT